MRCPHVWTLSARLSEDAALAVGRSFNVDAVRTPDRWYACRELPDSVSVPMRSLSRWQKEGIACELRDVPASDEEIARHA